MIQNLTILFGSYRLKNIFLQIKQSFCNVSTCFVLQVADQPSRVRAAVRTVHLRPVKQDRRPRLLPEEGTRSKGKFSLTNCEGIIFVVTSVGYSHLVQYSMLCQAR